MEREDPELIQLELKYCERCGALWFRLRGGVDIYCAPCDLEMLDLPVARQVPSRPRMPGNHKVEGRGQTLDSSAFCGQGGTA